MAENNVFFTWCKTNLSLLLGFPVGNEMINYVLSLENQREIGEHLGSLLDVTNDECKIFLEEFFKRWSPPTVNNIKAYKKHETNKNLINPITQKKNTTLATKTKRISTDKKGNFVKKEESNNMEVSPTKMSVDVRGADFLDKNKPMVEEVKIKSSSPFKKKNLKYVPLYSADGKVKTDVVMLPGRHPCQCLAQKHKLISNCSDCGRIVCEQEGSGLCLFCGNLVCSPEEREIIDRESKQGRKLREKLMNQTVPDDIVSYEKENECLKKAIEHKNRLLEFDKNCTKRTKVIDDEADYFSSDNRWLTKKQRDAVAKRDKELRDKRFASRFDKKFTIDFAGRKVVENMENNSTYVEEDIATPVQSLQNNDVITDFNINERFPLIDPRISVKPPQFQATTSSSAKDEVTNLLRTQQEAVRSMLRVQDKELQEMVDQGMCMSMHQPWASLLVHGIKKLEGRSWYTSHRGRLWIASTARNVDNDIVRSVEDGYRRTYDDQNEYIQFPSDYPVSALLGCVNVVDCVSNDEYFQKHPNCTEENGSAYLFVCENPEQLRIKFQIKGKHKIYKLDSDLHVAGRKNLSSA